MGLTRSQSGWLYSGRPHWEVIDYAAEEMARAAIMAKERDLMRQKMLPNIKLLLLEKP